MEKILQLGERKIVYTLKNSSRAKRIRLVVASSGEVKAIKPYFLSNHELESFVLGKFSWILGKLDYFAKKKKQMVFLPKVRKSDYLMQRERAFIDINERVGRINQAYNFQFNNLSIKNQKTRWGSCSIKGNLNFNFRIVFLGADLADYIITHELCHLKQKNHSSDFWHLVEKFVPDYKQKRKKLRKIHFS